MLNYLKTRLLLLIILGGGLSSAFAQEYYFQIIIKDRSEIETLTDIISIDDFRDSLICAYANEDEYQTLLDMGYKPRIIGNLKSVNPLKMMSEKADTVDWNAYPTHAQYVSIMNDFAARYPQICKLDTFGYSTLGRPLLTVKISDNVNTDEAEPEFLYSGQIHGDEILTYMLLLRLIDYLLASYDSDLRIKNLIDNSEIWINPLFNPDGTYHGQDTTVAGASRYNWNGIDLNRNFPDPARGDHPDGKDYQPETLSMMKFASEHHFVMSANLHSGSEVLNYPWDTWQKRVADDQWWQTVCRRYVDTVRVYAPQNYMTARDDGITNGYDWYSIHGGRQDYMNYFQHCREVTMELSYTKALPDSLLPVYWEYNKKALITYMEEIQHGVHGMVRDKSGRPLKAKISISDYDFDHSEVYSDSLNGDFHRLLLPGVYNLTVEAQGFTYRKIENVPVSDSAAAYLKVTLNRPPQILSYFPRKLDTVQLNKGYLFKVSVNDEDGDSLIYAFIHGDSAVYDTLASFSFNAFGKDSVLFFAADGEDTTFVRWVFEVPRITAVEEENNAAKKFALKQNYPNPFNPLTSIVYDIPASAGETDFLVKLDVFNSLGQKVRSFTKHRQRPGAHSLTVNARALSSGIYYYRISISGENKKKLYFTQIKKMIIIK